MLNGKGNMLCYVCIAFIGRIAHEQYTHASSTCNTDMAEQFGLCFLPVRTIIMRVQNCMGCFNWYLLASIKANTAYYLDYLCCCNYCSNNCFKAFTVALNGKQSLVWRERLIIFLAPLYLMVLCWCTHPSTRGERHYLEACIATLGWFLSCFWVLVMSRSVWLSSS